MFRYGGLSAVNLGLLFYFAGQGWRRNWSDWFWPAMLAIYVGEVIFETVQGGRGGGMIKFNDPAVKVATSAHLASAAYAVLAWLITWRAYRPRAQTALGQVDAGKLTLDRALKLDPKSPQAQDLKSRVEKLPSSRIEDLRAAVKANAAMSR